MKSFGWFEQDDALLIAMEYLELGDLDQYLRNVPPLPESEVGYIISQVIEGLNHMHENDFTHRDLKPGVRCPFVIYPNGHVANSDLRIFSSNPDHRKNGGSR